MLMRLKNVKSKWLESNIDIKMTLEILLPVLIFLFALNYILMAELVRALGGSEHADKIIKLDILVCVFFYISVAVSVINMIKKYAKPLDKPIASSKKYHDKSLEYKFDVIDNRAEIGQLTQAIKNTQLSINKIATILSSASYDIQNNYLNKPVKEENGSAAYTACNKTSGKTYQAINDYDIMLDRLISSLGKINEASAYITQAITVLQNIALQTSVSALNAAREVIHAGANSISTDTNTDILRDYIEIGYRAVKEATEVLNDSINKVKYALDIGWDMDREFNNFVMGIYLASILNSENKTKAAYKTDFIINGCKSKQMYETIYK
jgi:methyl-accepting chemotaxis protein